MQSLQTGFATTLLLVVVVAASSSSEGNLRPKRDLYYEPSADGSEDYLLNPFRNRLSHQGYGPWLLEQKRVGVLDFGVARGASGAKAAKARLGLKLANDPYGPGKR